MNAKNRIGGWRVAAAVIAAAGLIGSVEAQQGRRGGGNAGNRGPRPAAAPAQEETAKPSPAAQPRPRPSSQPKPAAAAPKPSSPSPSPRPDAGAPRPRPAAPAPTPPPLPPAAPKVTAPPPPPPAPKVVAPAPAPKPPAPAPKQVAPAPRPKITPPAPKPVAPAPAPQITAPAPKPVAPAPKPRISAPAPKPVAPAPKPQVTTPTPKPVAPSREPKVTPPAPRSTPPAIVVKRPDAPKPAAPIAQKPSRPVPGNNKPTDIVRDRKVPIAIPPERAKPDAPKSIETARVIKTDTPTYAPLPGRSVIKSTPIATNSLNRVANVPAAKPRVAGGGSTRAGSRDRTPAAAATGTPTIAFNNDPTFDSGLVRSNGLVRPLYDNTVHDRGYDRSHGQSYVVNAYSGEDYAWRTGTYVSYSSGYCAPTPCYPRWPYYSNPFYGSPLRSATIYTTYSPWCSSRYYTPCGPTYVAYCGPTYTTYCPPTYCAPTTCAPSYYDDSWNFSFGISSSSSWFGVSYNSGWWSSPSYYRSYDCWNPCYRPYRYVEPCAPRRGWWCQPTWGWSCVEPRGPVYPFPVNETIGAYGLTQAATVTVDPTQELEDAVYSTMRGRYQVAIDATRDAVLGAPELFAPGQTDLDKYQMQRATWALTVYENPPRAAVDAKDAAFMVAAIAALAGDHERAAEAAAEARDLGDDHPATLQLIEQLAMDDARADWGLQTTAR